MSGPMFVISSVSGASQLSTLLSPSSASDMAKFGGGPSSPCIFKNTTLLLITGTSASTSIVLHCTVVLLLSFLVG